MSNWTEELSDEHKEQIWHFIVETVKEIREQIAQDIEGTNDLWKGVKTTSELLPVPFTSFVLILLSRFQVLPQN